MDALLCLELCSIHAESKCLYLLLCILPLMSYPLDVDVSMHDRLEVTVMLVAVQTIQLVGLGQNLVFSTYKLSALEGYCEE